MRHPVTDRTMLPDSSGIPRLASLTTAGEDKHPAYLSFQTELLKEVKMLRRFAILFGLLAVVSLGSASAQWKFIKVFPDTSLSFSSGANNTVAVDPTGKIWFAPYINKSDSLMNAAGVMVGTGDLYVFNPDGSVYHKYQYFNYNGSVDTLLSPCTGYGMCTDQDGNILLMKGSDVLRRINYKTGDQMAKTVDPIPGYASSIGSPMVDAAGEVFLVPVVPTSGVGPIALASDFSSVLISVDTSTYGQYARNAAVTPDGNDVYAFHIGRGTYHYHSDNGTLGPYVFADTLFDSLVIETAAWQPKTGWLWVGSGNATSGMPGAPYSGYAWYGFDMSNPDKPVLKDSILWNADRSTITTVDPRPRGIAFSPSGDTAYVAAFNVSTGFLQMFTGKATAVNEPPRNVPSSYSLSQNYPNPFNPSTKIDYVLKATGRVSLVVYDVLGRKVVSLVDGVQSAGQHTATFNADNLPSGVYMYSLTTSDGFKFTKKMVLMK